MATQILAVGSSDAVSSEFVVEPGGTVTVALKGTEGIAVVDVQLKDDAGGWVLVGSMSAPISITGSGTYRVRRSGGAMCGVFYA